jgi:hypothetical protein
LIFHVCPFFISVSLSFSSWSSSSSLLLFLIFLSLPSLSFFLSFFFLHAVLPLYFILFQSSFFSLGVTTHHHHLISSISFFFFLISDLPISFSSHFLQPVLPSSLLSFVYFFYGLGKRKSGLLKQQLTVALMESIVGAGQGRAAAD